MDNTKKRQIKRYIAWGCLAAFVLLLAFMPMMASTEAQTDGPVAKILTGTVQTGNVSSDLHGGGALSEEDSTQITIPSGVKLKSFLVSNGDWVSEGDPVAEIDRVSVMTAITLAQESLDYLKDEMKECSNATTTAQITAQAGGRVKAVYAQPGDDVQKVMLKYGALAVISLDGMMAAELETDTELTAGDTVCVILPDQTKTTGRVETNLCGVLVLTVDDEGYDVGEEVTVTTEDGKILGSSTLYIHNALKVSAYSGTVDNVNVKKEETISSGRTILSLKDIDNSFEVEKLRKQCVEYENLMLDLFQMYESSVITAPCDGVISGVDEDSIHLLSEDGSGWTLTLLEDSSPQTDASYVAFASYVTRAYENGLELRLNPTAFRIDSMTNLGLIPLDIGSMTETLTYVGQTNTYIQTDDGLLYASGSAQAGDVLLFVGDENGIVWIIRTTVDSGVVHNTGTVNSGGVVLLSGDTNDMGEGESLDKSNVTVMLDAGSEGDSNPGGGSGTEGGSGTGEGSGTEGGTGTEGGSGTGEGSNTGEDSGNGEDSDPSDDPQSPICTKNENCTAEKHDPDCPQYVESNINPPYTGYVGIVVAVESDSISLYRYPDPITITVLNNPIDMTLMTVPGTFTGVVYADGSMQSTVTVAVGDIILDLGNGSAIKLSNNTQTVPGDISIPGIGDLSGLMAGMGGISGYGGYGGAISQEPAFELYDLAGSTIMEVTPQDTLKLTMMVDERDLTKVCLGQTADITVEALKNETFTATVTKIGMKGINNGGSSKFEIELTMERGANVLAGMNATATITISTTEDTLTIPVAALNEHGSSTIVYTGYDKNTGELINPVTVSIGCADGQNAQILSGLDEGDAYYYAYYDAQVLPVSDSVGK